MRKGDEFAVGYSAALPIAQPAIIFGTDAILALKLVICSSSVI